MSLFVARRGTIASRRGSDGGGVGDYATEVAADNPTWWLRLEETAGATAADEIGANDGTVTGANLATASFADTGSAANLDGVDDKIVVPHASLLNAGDTFTFECLVKVDNPTANAAQMIVDKTGFSTSNGQFFVVWDNRSGQPDTPKFRFQMRATGISSTELDRARVDWSGSAAQTAATNGVHLVCTFDKDASVSVRIVANGSQVATSTSGSVASPDGSNTRDVEIGTTLGGFYLGAIIDDPAIYDKVLSDARALVHAQAAGLA